MTSILVKGWRLHSEGLSKDWEEEKLEAMSIDKSFAQLCYKGQERNDVVA